jgi:hypothetical protein
MNLSFGSVPARIKGTVVLVLAVLAVAAQNGAAQSGSDHGDATTERFIGSWELVEWISTDDSGRVTYPYGERALGQISYMPNGRMSAHLMRPLDDSSGPRQHISYWGDFSLDTANATVTHQVIGSSQESFVGTGLVRSYAFEGSDRLVLSTGTLRLTWRRVR